MKYEVLIHDINGRKSKREYEKINQTVCRMKHFYKNLSTFEMILKNRLKITWYIPQTTEGQSILAFDPDAPQDRSSDTCALKVAKQARPNTNRSRPGRG